MMVVGVLMLMVIEVMRFEGLVMVVDWIRLCVCVVLGGVVVGRNCVGIGWCV